MNFNTLSLQSEYRSPQVDIVQAFYIPTLSCSISYKRAVGFFSSSALLEISRGICELAKKGGKIDLIASPHLSAEDLNAIQQGYENRSKIIENALLRGLQTEPKNTFEKERLNLLANLIETGVLNIKIAFTENNNSVGIYHEKLGLLEDSDGNKIAFSGSMNESGNAMTNNYETIDVFYSWKNESDKERVIQKEEAFSRIWGNYDNKLKVMHFTSIDKAILDKYKRGKPDFEIDKKEFSQKPTTPHTTCVSSNDIYTEKKDIYTESLDSNGIEIHNDSSIYEGETESLHYPFFTFTDGKTPRPHQQAAIENFKQNKYQSLFAMATGTGKTLTSLFATNELCTDHELSTILILVPLVDLVTQWNEDIQKYFSGTTILISSQFEWENNISEFIIQKKLDPNKIQKLVIISTYESFSRNKKRILKVITPDNTLIIADECHKTGAKSYRQNLPETISYRIGLSATPKRPYDDKGTKAIFDYFCPHDNPFEFTLEQAIATGMLCKYNYHPIPVPLTPDEMEDYSDITERINKIIIIINSDNATDEDTEHLEQMLKQRHRIIEQAENKFELFSEVFLKEIKKYSKNTIVFAPDGTDKNNKNILTKYMKCLKQTTREQKLYLTMVEYVQGTKKELLKHFSKGQIDIIFAKQRLNEGIDIPSARRAFFIASSTSEREFIQRRGRVLRLDEGKNLAEIFDFIVVPPEGAETFFDSKICNQIKQSEIKRALDFAKTANNFNDIASLLNKYI